MSTVPPRGHCATACALALLGLAACGETARLPPTAGEGVQPTLPLPNPTLIPTVNVAPVAGWPAQVAESNSGGAGSGRSGAG